MKKIFQPIVNPLVKKIDVVFSPTFMKPFFKVMTIPGVRWKSYIIEFAYLSIIFRINK